MNTTQITSTEVKAGHVITSGTGSFEVTSVERTGHATYLLVFDTKATTPVTLAMVLEPTQAVTIHTPEHTCYGRIFCGFPKVIARTECPACTPEDVEAARATLPSFLL